MSSMAGIFGSGDVAREAQIRDLQKQIEDLKSKLDEKKQEELPKQYRLAKALSEESKILFKWSAPARVYVKRNRQWYWTVALVVLAIVVLLAFFQQLALIAAVIAFMFVIYVVSTVPPGDIEYRLTDHGVEIGDVKKPEDMTAYTWEQIDTFWFSFKQNREVLNLDMKIAFPNRLALLFGRTDRKRIVDTLQEKLPYKAAPKRKPGWLERATDGIYIPFEEVSGETQATQTVLPRK
jgi:hypothetical protein